MCHTVHSACTQSACFALVLLENFDQDPPYLHGTKSLTSHIPPYEMAPETNPNQMLNNGKIFSCHFQICTQPYSQIGLERPLPNVFQQTKIKSLRNKTDQFFPSVHYCLLASSHWFIFLVKHTVNWSALKFFCVVVV